MTPLQLAKCHSCGLNCNRIVAGYGEESPDLMIIGDAPGRAEHYQQVPFVGDGGKLLHAALDGIREQTTNFTTYYTYLVLCNPPEGRKPTDSEIISCFARLEAEIEQIKPKRILMLGAVTAEALLNAKKLNDVRGKLTEYQGIPTLATYSPNFVLKSTNVWQTFIDDICRLMDGQKDSAEWQAPRNPVVIESADELLEVFSKFEKTTLPTFVDLETTHLNPFMGFPLWIGIHFPEYQETYIVKHELFAEHAKQFPSHCNIGCHDSRMEWLWMKKHYGIELTNLDDTLQMYHQLDGRTGQSAEKDLKTLGMQILGVHDWSIPVKPYIKGMMFHCPQDVLEQYLSYDVEVNAGVYFHVKKELIEDNVNGVYENVIKPSVPFLHRMTDRGIRCNTGKAEELMEEIEVEVNKVKEQIQDIVGSREFNPGSWQQLQNYLYTEQRLPNKYKGSTNEKAIKELAETVEHPILEPLLEFRGIKKIHGIVKGIYEAIGPDGRMHSKFLLEGTTTGRLASKDYNLQNIPRKDTSKWNIRSLFEPEIGMLLADNDYAQLEFKVGVHMANDRAAIEFIAAGRDIHKEMAAFVLGIPLDQVTKQQRQFAKNMVFAVMFDASIDGLVYLFKKDFPFITRELTEKFITTIRQQFPDLYFNALKFKAEALKSNEVVTLFGRKRRFPLITKENRDEILKQATNAPIQGTASDICLLAAQRIEKEMPEVRIHILVHDSIVASVPSEQHAIDMCSIMGEVPFETEVIFAAEHKVGTEWGM